MPTLNFGGKKLNLSLFLHCTLYKYNRIPFLLVIYIRKTNTPATLQSYRIYRKVSPIFPNGKSLGYSRPIGRFWENTRFSEGDFEGNSLNIGQLNAIFTFIFWFNLEKMPENREFHPKFTYYASHVQNKNPGNTPNGYATGIPPTL